MPGEACPIRPPPGLVQRVDALVSFYRMVHLDRMHDVPIINPALCVEALGFRCEPAPTGQPPRAAEGVLITPWFMSLVRLPLAVEPAHGRVGRKFEHRFGNECFEFIGAHDPLIGYHESCALFSPMNEFSDQAVARTTAQAVRDALDAEPLATVDTRPPASASSPAHALAMPGRRAFFLPRPNGTPPPAR